MLPPFPPKLHLAETPTALRPLDRISAALGGPRIWLKCDDLTGSLVSGNKVRKLEFLLADALAKGCDTVITCGGLQSNHCRATAALCARLGLKCHLILRGSPDMEEGDTPYSPGALYPEGSDGNLLLGTLCGATVSVYSPKHYAQQQQALFAHWQQHYQARGAKAYAIPTGGSNGLGLWGYIDTARELQADFLANDINPELIVCATGSGGTQGGLTLGMHLLNASCQVIGMAVCDSERYFHDKIVADVAEWQTQFLPQSNDLADALAVNTNAHYIGPGYALGYPELFETIAWLAREEGVVLDPVYTGKAFHGLCEEIKSGAFANMSDLVFIHTGGIFGLFPFKAAFS